jgi:hypothetical protein
MAKRKFDTRFDFGANVAGKRATGKKKGGKRSTAQQATAAWYLKSRRK